MGKHILILGLIYTTLLGCGKTSSSSEDEEAAQQIGDVMASVDEAGGSSGSISFNQTTDEDKILKQSKRVFAKFGSEITPSSFRSTNLFSNSLANALISPAYATSCLLAPGFGSCSSNVITRNFNGCTIGFATFTGTVTFTWGGTSSSCTLGAAGDTITRVPNFTVTGLRSASLAVTKTGSVGQRLTWASGSGSSKVFNFTNDGIRRVFTLGSSTLLDFTTQTTSAITVTGTTRSNRVMTGGALQVTNNLNSNVCTYVPSNISWTSGCNCPTSGSWSGTCTDGNSTVLTITGCGTATFALGTQSASITFDRCL